MAIIGKAVKKAINIGNKVGNISLPRDPFVLQQRTLVKLMTKANQTSFGKAYSFKTIINSNNPTGKFSENVPIFDYNTIHDQWWHRSLMGEKDVTWPGYIKYFALSSGTSESSSKRIPVSRESIRAITRVGLKQLISLAEYNLPESLFEKDILMIGGSIDLNYKGTYYEGDLSGISAGNIPFWFQPYYKPGREIAAEKDWGLKLDEIMRKSKDWDIGIIVGVPAWLQIVLEKVIAFHQVKHIHEVWPNLQVFVHGGVSFEPYRSSFNKLLGHPIWFLETYLASEGFIAFQNRKNATGLKLLLNNGIYFEFLPFNEQNFDTDGKVKESAKSLTIQEVEEGVEYALLLSTCAGAWRYLIGDTIRFVSKEKSEIIITGRIKHFLSLCGEHLSVDNMNKALQKVSQKTGIEINEYTVCGKPSGSGFTHHWIIGTDKPADSSQISDLLDQYLMELNDDYAVERKSALKGLEVKVVPVELFSNWMKREGKEGGQNKFPRVMKPELFQEWLTFTESELNK